MLEAALKYAARGWPVLPVKPRGKLPLTQHGVKDASVDEATIRAWWQKWPTANIGIACGRQAGIVVLDVDAKGDGQKELFVLVVGEMPMTPTADTGGGGLHLFFACPEGLTVRNAVGIRSGLDIRSDGGYIVAAPSIHESGRLYAWQAGKDPDSVPLAPIPGWLLPLLKTDKGNATDVLLPIEKPPLKAGMIPEGQRNARLTSLAGAVRRHGASADTIIQTLRAENANCSPPLPDAELRVIAESVARYEPNKDMERTDAGNAERLILRHGQDLKYAYVWKKWLRYDGNRWRLADHGELVGMAVDTVRGIYAEASEGLDETTRKAIANHAKASESRRALDAMMELAQHMVPVRVEELDASLTFLQLKNGVLDVLTGEIRESSRDYLHTKCAGVAYDADARAPHWLAFLERIFDGDAELIGYMQRVLGYCLTGDTSDQSLFIAYGSGANGKSTLFSVMARLLGEYAMATPVSALMARERGASIPNDVARLRGIRLSVSAETEAGGRLAESLIKTLTGGDVVSARFLYGEFFDFTPTAKLWILANHKPVIKGTDAGIWRRIRLIPFTVTIPEAEQDPKLPDKLAMELPGILNWCMEGALAWQREGLRAPAAVMVATKAFREESDLLAGFLASETKPDPIGMVQASTLYSAFMRYCEEAGEKPPSLTWFGRRLGDLGYDSTKKKTGKLYIGLRIADPDAAMEMAPKAGIAPGKDVKREAETQTDLRDDLY